MFKPRSSKSPNEANSRYHVEHFNVVWGDYHLQQPLPRGIPNPEYEDEHLECQQDVVEYLTQVLNILNQQTFESDMPHMVQNIFQHELQYQSTCEKCRRLKKYKPDHGFFLGAVVDGKQQRTIEQAINHFLFSPNDVIDWTCEHCNRKNKTARRGVIQDAPEILLVQLNRFDLDEEGEQASKLKAPVIFEESLDITENYKRHPGEDPDERLRYQLFAVIYHKGESISEGHYYTYVRGPTGRWSSIDDHIAKGTSFADVTNAQSEDDCVYVLAYCRKPKPTKGAADSQPQTREGTAQLGAQAASDERSVDIQAQIKIGERTLIGNLGGRLTLPGTGPLVVVGGRKRVQPATVKIDMTMGNSKLAGDVKGNLRFEPGVPDRRSHPPATGSQFATPQPALPQEPAAQGTGRPRTGPKPRGLKLNGPKSAIPVEASKKRKRDQVEESQDPQEFGKPAQSPKRQKPGCKQKANKGGESRSKKKNNRNQKNGSGGKPKGGKGHQKTNEGNEAPAAVNAGNGQPGLADRVHKPTKRLLTLTHGKGRNPDVQAGVPVTYPETTPGEHTREYQEGVLEEYKSGDQRRNQGRTGGYLEGDLVQPPPQPPVKPPAKVKPQRPPKPPPREGTRKKLPRTGKK